MHQLCSSKVVQRKHLELLRRKIENSKPKKKQKKNKKSEKAKEMRQKIKLNKVNALKSLEISHLSGYFCMFEAHFCMSGGCS